MDNLIELTNNLILDNDLMFDETFMELIYQMRYNNMEIYDGDSVITPSNYDDIYVDNDDEL